MQERYQRHIIIVILAMSTIIHTTGCGYFISPTVMEVLNRNEQVETFYGEGIEKSYVNGELVQELVFKEWKGKNEKYHSKAQVRTEKNFFEQLSDEEITDEMLEDGFVIQTEEDTFNDTQLIAYLPYKNQYCIKDMSLAAEVTDNVRTGISKVLEEGSLKDYVMNLINTYEEEYALTIENDVRINNYLTQHITAVPKDKNKDEQYEFWVDQNSWLIVRQVERQGDLIIKSEYTKFELNPKIDESLFEVSIPEDAEIEYINDNLEKKNEKVTISEAIRCLDSPIFCLEGQSGVRLIEVHYIEAIDERYGRVELTYMTDSGDEFIIRNSPSSKLYEKLELGYEKINVRGIKGSYIETGGIKVIEFIDQNIICDVYIKNSEMSKEELIELANRLQFIGLENE